MAIEAARSLCIITFFEKYNGFTFTHQSGAFRCKQHPSLAAKNDQHSWYWHSKGVGGYGALDYLIKAENMSFRDAVKVTEPFLYIAVIADDEPMPRPRATKPTFQTQSAPQPTPRQPKTLILLEKAGVTLRLYDYLCNKRGIDSDIVNTLIQKEMLYEDRRDNVVFVGHDEQGKPRFASLRGTQGDCSFRGDCSGSDKRYGFNTVAAVPSDRLYIFKSPIDLMSHASLANAITGDKTAWEHHNRLSLAGTNDTAMPFFLNQHKAVKELIFCLDNDTAGREATTQMARKYAAMGYIARIEPPKGKDFNNDLQTLRAQIQAEKRPKTRHYDTSR